MPSLKHLLEDLEGLAEEPDGVRLEAAEYDEIVERVRKASQQED